MLVAVIAEKTKFQNEFGFRDIFHSFLEMTLVLYALHFLSYKNVKTL